MSAYLANDVENCDKQDESQAHDDDDDLKWVQHRVRVTGGSHATRCTRLGALAGVHAQLCVRAQLQMMQIMNRWNTRSQQ
jgi:hypothetical protein